MERTVTLGQFKEKEGVTQEIQYCILLNFNKRICSLTSVEIRHSSRSSMNRVFHEGALAVLN
jgi:hypothetical protein